MNRLFKTVLAAWTCLFAGSPSFSTDAMGVKSMGTDFAFNLFRAQTKGKNENVLISPFSAHSALCMTLNGAAGKTLEQMSSALGTTPDGVEQLNRTNGEIRAQLTDNKDVKLEIANAIYADKSTPFKKSFIDLCQAKYDAAVHDEDFGSPETVKKINAWCNEKTHGKITEILQKLTKQEKMVLLNAIYFKGAWQNKFDKNATRDDRFTTENGEKTPISMMHSRGHLSYFKGSDFASISLPYAGGKQQMYIFLPSESTGIAALEGQFTKQNWTKWIASYKPTNITLSLPKFKIEYSTELKPALMAIGMHNAFDPTADFTKMIEKSAWISRVLQKTYMDVSEEGTEAAAVTAVVMAPRAMSAAPKVEIEFRVDKPFILALVDQPTGEILFLGAVAKP